MVERNRAIVSQLPARINAASPACARRAGYVAEPACYAWRMHELDLPSPTRDDRRPRLAGVTVPLAIAGGVGIVVARLAALDSAPPGFAVAEARGALAAQAIGRDYLPLLPDATRDAGDSPLFLWVVRLTGELAGWGVTGPRLAAALFGLLAVAGCALWYRRALGPGWAVAGALLAGTSFWQLVSSRQATPEIATAAGAAAGLACLWEGHARAFAGTRRLTWYAAAGATVALGAYAGPAGLVLLPVAVAAGAVLTRRGDDAGSDRTGLLVALAALLLVAAPLLVQTFADPGTLRAGLEQDWDRDGATEQLRDPADIVTGYAISARSIAHMGYDAQAVNLPGRALLDPLLALWAVAGLLVALRRPGDRLHGVALIWLAGSLLTPAIVAPGHPGLLLPVTPVLFLLALLGLRAAQAWVVARSSWAARLAPAIVVASVAVSASWSLYDYAARWAPSDATWRAFDGDVRASLEAAGQLPGAAPVAYATSPAIAPIVDYLGADLALRTFDGDSTLPLPAEGGRFLVFSRSAEPPATLLRYLAGAPRTTGTTPDGESAWQAWHAGQAARETLPYTLPVIHFPGGVDLIGFDVGPDFGDIETTGQLPDPPRMRVTLIWRVPLGAPPLVARVRLVPVVAPDDPALARFADVALVTAPPTPDEPGRHELIVVEGIVAVPPTPDGIADVQAGLLAPDGTLLPPTSPAGASSGDYAYLNRVQYVAE
jgi:hypothetical protein